MDEDTHRSPLPAAIRSHYATGYEQQRLQHGISRLEFARTQQLLQAVLPAPPAQLLDIGGGPGADAAWLAQAGYQVQLLDASPLHVAQARVTARQQPAHPFAVALGDARALPFAAQSADAVLLCGPLYHLTEHAERVGAPREAHCVLRPGGLLVAAAISRFASLVDGLRCRFGICSEDGFYPRCRELWT